VCIVNQPIHSFTHSFIRFNSGSKAHKTAQTEQTWVSDVTEVGVGHYGDWK